MSAFFSYYIANRVNFWDVPFFLNIFIKLGFIYGFLLNSFKKLYSHFSLII